MNKSINAKSVRHLVENVEFGVRDKHGNIKLLWLNNKLGNFLLRGLRLMFTAHQPDSPDYGWKAYLALYGFRIPFLTGSWGETLAFHNLITNAGFAGAASRLNGAGGEAAFIYIAVGTGTTVADVTDTTLETEISDSGLSRASATASRVTTGVTNDTSRLNKQFSVSGTKAITESGVLNAASVGVLLAHQVFSAVNVVSGDTLDTTWDVDHS